MEEHSTNQGVVDDLHVEIYDVVDGYGSSGQRYLDSLYHIRRKPP